MWPWTACRPRAAEDGDPEAALSRQPRAGARRADLGADAERGGGGSVLPAQACLRDRHGRPPHHPQVLGGDALLRPGQRAAQGPPGRRRRGLGPVRRGHGADDDRRARTRASSGPRRLRPRAAGAAPRRPRRRPARQPGRDRDRPPPGRPRRDRRHRRHLGQRPDDAGGGPVRPDAGGGRNAGGRRRALPREPRRGAGPQGALPAGGTLAQRLRRPHVGVRQSRLPLLRPRQDRRADPPPRPRPDAPRSRAADRGLFGQDAEPGLAHRHLVRRQRPARGAGARASGRDRPPRRRQPVLRARFRGGGRHPRASDGRAQQGHGRAARLGRPRRGDRALRPHPRPLRGADRNGDGGGASADPFAIGRAMAGHV